MRRVDYADRLDHAAVEQEGEQWAGLEVVNL